MTVFGPAARGVAEMARLNRPLTRSHAPTAAPTAAVATNPVKSYAGVGTAQVCTMLQYAALLKKKGYSVLGGELTTAIATARVDNEGSWKSNAKAGMKLKLKNGIDSNPNYGPELRYQLEKPIF